jgi:hypothetical protein
MKGMDVQERKLEFFASSTEVQDEIYSARKGGIVETILTKLLRQFMIWL